MLHYVTPCFVTSTDQGVWTVSSCFVTNETNETDHQWELLLVCFICFILFQSILEYSLYILIVTSVSVTEKENVPKKNLRGFCAVSTQSPLLCSKTGVYRAIHYFSYFCSKHRSWYSLVLPRWGGSNVYPQSMFWAEIWKISQFFIWKF